MSDRERILALLLLAGLLWLGLWWPAGANVPFSADWKVDEIVAQAGESFVSVGERGGMISLAAIAGLFMGSLLNWGGDYLLRFSSSRSPSSPGSNIYPVPVWWRCAMRREWDWPGITVELLSAFLFAAFWAQRGPSWRLLELAFYSLIFLLIALIDLRHRLVLNVVIYPAILITLLIRFLSPRPGILSALLGGAFGLLLFLVLMLAGRRALGAGDVKLAAFIGVVVGFPQVLWALALGILAGGVGALLILITRRGGLKSYFPYAPFLCLGAICVLLHST